MGKMSENNKKKLMELIEDGGVKSLIIWCGAGISFDMPCRLPLGDELSRVLFDNYFIYNESIRNIWRKCNEHIKTYINIHKFMRPEVIISCLTRFNYLKATNIFYKKFSSLDSARFNIDHCLLAYFLYSGGVIFTTNFDTCIERAYEKLFAMELSKIPVYNGKVVKYRAISGGEVIHLHGTFEYGKESGSSIENVMKGFDEKTLELIQGALTNKINFFVGYSFSDDYDLNYIFRRIPIDKNIFVCSHSIDDFTLQSNVSAVFDDFASIIECDTEKLLELVVSTVTKMRVALENLEMNCVKWDNMIRMPSNMLKKYKLIYTVALINQLQISYKAIDKHIFTQYYMRQNLLKKELADQNEILKYNLKVNSVGIWKKTCELEDIGLRKALKSRLQINFFRSNAKLKRMEKANRLNDIYNKLIKREKINNNDHELISLYMRIYTIYYLLGCNQDRFKQLKEVNILMSELEYS